MHLYLMRHATAVASSDWDGGDDTRPLSDAGESQARAQVARLAGEKGARVVAVWSSPFARALKTAEIAGEALSAPVQARAELRAGAANLQALRKMHAAAGSPESLLVVGHNPDLSVLLCDATGQREASLGTAGIALLTGPLEPGKMTLAWRL